MQRRHALITAAAAVASAPFGVLLARRHFAAETPTPGLVADTARVLDLADGFSYRIVERSFEPMSDGFRVPKMPDGMVCQLVDGDWVLMRNHELDVVGGGAYESEPPNEAFDPRYFGAVTRLVIDPETLARKSSNLVLTGTARNCAGGLSPWGFISCEESTDRGHGFAFLCDPRAKRVAPPKPITSFGRFRREAACVDPNSATTYMTEDEWDACLYRFVPDHAPRPFEGRLQALKIAGEHQFDTSALESRRELNVEWVDLHPNSESPLRMHAQQLGAATIRRGEGIWFDAGSVFLCATAGGPIGAGQVFALDTQSSKLKVIATSVDRAELDMPDNITVAPSGNLYVAEDGSGEQFIRIVTREGRIQTLAKNALSTGEFTGLCFSPDGGVLFANMQADGLTVAIAGPFA